MAEVPPIVPDIIALPETFPAVEIVANLVSTMAAALLMSALTIVPSTIFTDVIELSAKSNVAIVPSIIFADEIALSIIFGSLLHYQ
ncbi:MAG: hypothetical protein IPJ20_13905 [Flammeovirgaceae bacterium]|nr:hypothetical protein [Flammeovirgaceae bacterium]